MGLFYPALAWLLALLASLAQADHHGTAALLYLSKYGYIAPSNGTQALVSEDKIAEYVAGAVKDFQAFAGLNQTGELDPVTVELMGTPRCGVRDRGVTARPAANSRNSQQQPQWPGHTGCSRMI